MLARRKSREEERARLRDRFAEAYGAYAEYCEFAYAVQWQAYSSADQTVGSGRREAIPGSTPARASWKPGPSERSLAGIASTSRNS
jgi:hypothetical protein